MFTDEDFEAAYSIRSRLLLEEHKELLAGKSVLEIAACKGEFTKYISKVAKNVCAVEIMEEYAKHIRLPNVTVDTSDIHQRIWSFLPGTFDTVICAGFMYHTAHPLSILEGIANLSPRYVLIDNLDHKAPESELTLDDARKFVNQSYNRHNMKPDCGLVLMIGWKLLIFVMDRLGYRVHTMLDKSDVAETSNYLVAWKKSSSIWFERKKRRTEDFRANAHHEPRRTRRTRRTSC